MKYLLSLVIALVPFTTSANVTIDYLGNQLVYEGNPRLETVLKGTVKSRDIYWPAAALFNYQAPEEMKLKKQLMQKLAEVKLRTGTKTAKYKALLSLEAQIESWSIAHRVPIPIDYDFARVREELNPRIDDGHFALFLPARSPQIKVFGVLENELQINHVGALPVQSYKDKIDQLDYADSEFVFVIFLDGHFKKVSTSTHSQQRVEVPPGGSIYIPLKELPFDSENSQINQMVVKLAGSRLQ